MFSVVYVRFYNGDNDHCRPNLYLLTPRVIRLSGNTRSTYCRPGTRGGGAIVLWTGHSKCLSHEGRPLTEDSLLPCLRLRTYGWRGDHERFLRSRGPVLSLSHLSSVLPVFGLLSFKDQVQGSRVRGLKFGLEFRRGDTENGLSDPSPTLLEVGGGSDGVRRRGNRRLPKQRSPFTLGGLQGGDFSLSPRSKTGRLRSRVETSK